jgi:hypothetical protein
VLRVAAGIWRGNDYNNHVHGSVSAFMTLYHDYRTISASCFNHVHTIRLFNFRFSPS